jgi:hypothetical protein
LLFLRLEDNIKYRPCLRPGLNWYAACQTEKHCVPAIHYTSVLFSILIQLISGCQYRMILVCGMPNGKKHCVPAFPYTSVLLCKYFDTVNQRCQYRMILVCGMPNGKNIAFPHFPIPVFYYVRILIQLISGANTE